MEGETKRKEVVSSFLATAWQQLAAAAQLFPHTYIRIRMSLLPHLVRKRRNW